MLRSTTTDAAAPVEDSGRAAARVQGATKVYGEGTNTVRALEDVSVEFASGAFTAIMGPSGSGKSTLMHCVAGLDSLTNGHVWIGEARLSDMSERERTLLRRTKIGFIFQAYNLVPTLTAQENIELPYKLSGERPDQRWLDEVIHAVRLDQRRNHLPSELSGGQQQRVAVARALATRPDIIFADEPTGNLDSASGEEILQFLRRAVDEWHQSVVMVTHDPVAASYADRIVFLDDGAIVDEITDPTVDDVLDKLHHLRGG